jgi:hypothetical protein
MTEWWKTHHRSLGSSPTFTAKMGTLELEVGIECDGFAYWQVSCSSEDQLAGGNVIDPELGDGPNAPDGWQKRTIAIAKARCERVARTLAVEAAG